MRAASLILLLWLGTPAARGAYPIRRAAPEFPKDDVWVNSKPLTLQRLRGRRSVLVVFLNTDNINSLRAIKILNAWNQRYAFSGLMIIGVHTPAFSFQRDPAVVRADARQREIEFPIVLDNDRKLWEAYRNEGWPSFYLVDHKGRVIYDRVGENRYTELESELREAASAVGYKIKEAPTAMDPPAKDCGAATPEFSVLKDKPVSDYTQEGGLTTLVAAAREGSIFTKGPWKTDGDKLHLTEDNLTLAHSLRAVYRGAQGLALLSSGPEKSMKFFVRQDDLWLHPNNAGAEIKFDDGGESYVLVSTARLYAVTRNANDDPHLISFFPMKAGGAFYGFSSTDRCLPYAP